MNGLETIFPVKDPVRLRTSLLEVDWGSRTANGLVIARVCPMCQAIIPADFTNTTATTPRLQHIDYHVTIAATLQRITGG